MAAVASRIISGEPTIERRSTFQAHVCQVTDPKEVAAVISVLLQNNKWVWTGGACGCDGYRMADSDLHDAQSDLPVASRA